MTYSRLFGKTGAQSGVKDRTAAPHARRPELVRHRHPDRPPRLSDREYRRDHRLPVLHERDTHLVPNVLPSSRVRLARRLVRACDPRARVHESQLCPRHRPRLSYLRRRARRAIARDRRRTRLLPNLQRHRVCRLLVRLCDDEPRDAPAHWPYSLASLQLPRAHHAGDNPHAARLCLPRTRLNPERRTALGVLLLCLKAAHRDAALQ